MVLGTRQATGTSSSGGAAGATNSAQNCKTIASQKYLTNCKSFYSCIHCRTHLANHDELISRSFYGNRTRAYLFNSVINITTGRPVQRELNTGAHTVADISCSNCSTTIGWKYEKAHVESQKYKEGKYIIELAHAVRENHHLELDKRDMFLGALSGAGGVDGPVARHQPQPATERRLTSSTTVGQRHQQGSLSPLREMGRWSSSCATSPSASSSASSNESEARLHEPTSGESDDEEDVLMFPFHDDLIGERANYSDLPISRLSSRRRIRRSLHLDSVPYDWKYSARSPPSAQTSNGLLRVGSMPPRLPTADEQHRQRAASETQFELEQINDEITAQSGTSRGDTGGQQQQQRPTATTTMDSNSATGDKLSRMNSVSVGDEEFYDCCTDHTVSIVMTDDDSDVED